MNVGTRTSNVGSMNLESIKLMTKQLQKNKIIFLNVQKIGEHGKGKCFRNIKVLKEIIQEKM